MSNDGGGDGDELTDLHHVVEHRLDALVAQLGAARDDDDGSDATRQAHVDAAIALIVGLFDELDDERAEGELEAMLPLVAHDARLEIATRRRLATKLVEIQEREKAIAQLRAAHRLARERGLREIGAEIEGVLAIEERRHDETRETLATTTLTGSLVMPAPEVAARMELSRAADGGEWSEDHAREAYEQAKLARDDGLLHQAAVAYAEALAARDALAEAEEVLEALPPLDDQLETRALLEEVWRRLGSHLEDEPDEPDEPNEMDRALRAYITKPRNLAQALVDGGLPASDRIREWSYGQLHAAADLESQRIFGPVRSFWCACGRYRGRAYVGIVCKRCGVELIHAASRRARSGHIVLATAVAHPWYVPAAAMLLAKTPVDVEAMSADALRSALAEIDLEWLGDDLKREIVTAPKAKIADAAGKRLAVVEAFRSARTHAYTRPEHVVIEIVPVVPPHGELGCDRGPVRDAYAQILEATASETNAAVRRLFDAFSAR